MTQQEVNRLIDKYMEGKTSLEEERQLAIEVNRPDAPRKEAGSSAPLYRLECGSSGSMSDIVVRAGEVQHSDSSTGYDSSNSATAHPNGEA